MNAKKIVAAFNQYWPFYILGVTFIAMMKCFCSGAGSESLDWILAPTARFAGALSGIPFTRVPPAGYVNHGARFIIAASCSGVQFLIITFSTVYFSFTHRMRPKKAGIMWFALSLGISFAYTVFINGIRIAVSLRLRNIHAAGWLTTERLHLLEGVLLYFISLIMIYRIADKLSGLILRLLSSSLSAILRGSQSGSLSAILRGSQSGSLSAILRGSQSGLFSGDMSMGINGITGIGLFGKLTGGFDRNIAENEKALTKKRLFQCIPPLFWYLIITIGMPFLNSALFKKQWNFAEYAIIVSVTCLAVIIFFNLAYLPFKQPRKQC